MGQAVSPTSLYGEALNAGVMVFEDQAFGRWFRWDQGGGPHDGISDLKRRDVEELVLCGDTVRKGPSASQWESSPDPGHAGSLIKDFQPPD